MTAYDICKQNWQRILVGDPQQLQLDDTVKGYITACEEKTQKAWAQYKACGAQPDRVGLFRDTPATHSADMTAEYRTLADMALGYATYGTNCYQDPQLLADILAALEWGYHHYYGKAEIENRGWRDVTQFNWWDWSIGTSTQLMNTLVLVDAHLTLQQKRDYLEYFAFRVRAPRDYGANKVNYGRLLAQAGVLCQWDDMIYTGRDGIADTFLYADGGVNNGQGYYRDGSYVFHTRHPMNFTYGIEHFSMLTDFVAILANSDFAFAPSQTELLYTWMEHSHLPFCRGGEIFRSVLGRSPQRTEEAAREFIKRIVRLYGMSPEEKKQPLADVIAMLTDENPLLRDGDRSALYSIFTLGDYLTFREAYERAQAKKRPTGFHAFNCMDRAVQHRESYSFSLSLSSSRIYNYECINSQNMTGWYHGDGMLNLISSPYKYAAAYWEQVDPYRIPGTTADDRVRVAATIAQRNEYLSSRDFVGALSAGDTGMAVMELESCHCAEGEGGMDDGSYGGPLPTRDCSLTAHKAYFFMDGYAVCMGSAVTAHDDAKVCTILENCHGETIVKNGAIAGYAPLSVTFNGEQIELPTEDTMYEKIKYITVGSDAFCILDGKPITAKQTEGELPFAQLLIDHGVNPAGDTYAYALLPMTDAAGAKAFTEKLPFQILANTETLQAIRELATGDMYCIFHAAGELRTADTVLSAAAPILCALKGDTLYACDVTQKQTSVTVTVNGKPKVFNFKDTWGKTKQSSL